MTPSDRLDRKVSAWSVWLHPRRAALRIGQADALCEEIAHKDAEIDSLKSELAVSRDTISLLETEVHALKTADADFRTRYNALRNQLNIADEKISDLQKEIAAHMDFDAAIAQLENQLAQAEKMKHGFENRIAILNLKIEEAQRRLRQAGLRSDFLADPHPIQMDSPNPSDHTLPTTPSSLHPALPPSPPNNKIQKPKPTDPTVWLRDIPDNI